jgi:hypothetical protein
LQSTWSQERTKMTDDIFVTRDCNYPQQQTLLRMRHPPDNNSGTSSKTKTEIVTNPDSPVVGTVFCPCLCPCPQFFCLPRPIVDVGTQDPLVFFLMLITTGHVYLTTCLILSSKAYIPLYRLHSKPYCLYRKSTAFMCGMRCKAIPKYKLLVPCQ